MINENLGRITASVFRTGVSIISERLKDLKIKSGQMGFLYTIILNEGLTQTELSNMSFVGKSATAKAVKVLVANGYVEQVTCPEDRRTKRLFLTAEGRMVAPAVLSAFNDVNALYKKNLADDEIKQVVHALEKVLCGLLEYKAERRHEDFNEYGIYKMLHSK